MLPLKKRSLKNLKKKKKERLFQRSVSGSKLYCVAGISFGINEIANSSRNEWLKKAGTMTDS